MKALHVTTHMNVGGIANYIFTLAKALKQEKVECMAASSGGDMVKELEEAGIKHKSLNINTKFEFSPKVFKSAFDIARIVREENIDVIHAHSRVSQVAACFASSMAGKPYVATCHGYFKKRSRGLFDTWGVKVIAISEAVREHLRNDLGVKDSRIRLIYSGVDADRFKRVYSVEEISEIRRSLGIADGPIIGTIGRLSTVKGQRFLVEAMRQIVSKMPEVICLILGNGEEEEPLKALAASLGIKDSIRFFNADMDTPKFLAVMYVFVFPSVKEGLGIALLEALAAGKACVASNVGGIGNVIEQNVSGLLVPAGDPGRIAEAVMRLLKDDGLRKTMGDNGRKLIRDRFAIDSMAKSVAELYNEVV